jgi:hypothetical protein
MTIQSLSNRPREIGVTEPIEPAYERVKRMLFQPFDFTKWIIIGFCAWLAGLGESGGGGSYGGFNNNNNHGAQPGEQFRHFYNGARDYVLANLDWIIPVAAFFIVLFLVIWLLVLWLNSRGKFMFLHCVVWDKAEVDVPWHKYAAAGNSLFCFRIAVGLAGMVLLLPLLAFGAIDILRMVMHGAPDFAGVMLAIGLVVAFILVALFFALIHKLTGDFVVPIMFLRGGTCLAAWRELLGLLTAHPGEFIVYILFQIVLQIAISMIVFVAFVVTCCIACCLVMLPFIGTVVLLPILVFKRAYSLYYLAQFGPQYDVFPTPPVPPTAPAQPISPLAAVP